MKKQAVMIFIISIALIGLAFHFQTKLAEFKTLGLIGIFIINFFGSATIFLPTPAIASIVAGGIIYPPILVALSAALGGAGGELTGVLLGHSGRMMLIKDHHAIYIKLKYYFKRYADVIILISALIPNPFFDIVGVMAGVFSFSPVRFFILVFLGRFIRDIILAYIGAKL